MPIARKIEKDISKDFLNQMKSNLTKTTTVVEEEPPVVEKSAPVITPSPTNATPKAFENAPASALTPKTDKYADVMNIRLSKGRRNEIKAFCSSNGVTVTQFIESSYEFLAREVAAGNISISKGGISKKII